MYELSVRRRFTATHSITIAGVPETPHEHDWGVELVVAGRSLDADGLLCDFHDLERGLDEIVAAFRDRDLNATPPFDRINPTAEHVAKHIADALELPDGVTLSRVTVTEAPGCDASYVP